MKMGRFTHLYFHIRDKIQIKIFEQEFEGFAYVNLSTKGWNRAEYTDRYYLGEQQWIEGSLQRRENSWWTLPLLGTAASCWLDAQTDQSRKIKEQLIQKCLSLTFHMPWNCQRIHEEIMHRWKAKTLENCILSTCIFLKIIEHLIK